MNLDKKKNADSLFPPVLLFLLAIITRIPFSSKLLYHMDSVQFALALEKYDITIHQPHPPGYFLYVMLGRLLNFFIKDANTVFVSISIIFSGLTVVAVYYLGKELFDKKIGFLAGVLALTSPSLWFHGEVAFTYAIEAFFSAFIALLCWRIANGDERYLWVSAVALAIAGGMRQSTAVFLFPLWLLSMKGLPFRRIVASLAIFGLISISWFLLMVLMTGGWEKYTLAFRQLLQSAVAPSTVFEKGWPALIFHSQVLFNFTIYALGGGIVILLFVLYYTIRNRRLSLLDTARVKFFSIWGLPSFLFFLLITISPAVPGHALILLPPFILLAARATIYFIDEMKNISNLDLSVPLISILIFVNLYIFFFSKYSVSYLMIREHDRSFLEISKRMRTFDPSNTVLFLSQNYIYYGLTHFIYYLPEYMAYDPGVFPPGVKRWAGIDGNTVLTDDVVLSTNARNFITLLYQDDGNWYDAIKGELSVEPIYMDIMPTIYIVSGPISEVKKIYPHLRYKASPKPQLMDAKSPH